MSLADRIAAVSRRPTATVRVNGVRWDGWLTLSCDQSYGGNIGSGEATGRALPPGVAVGTPISWSWGYDGHDVAGFAGVVTEIGTASYPNRTSLKLADPLWKASRQQKDIATSPLNNIAASEAITQILGGAGLTRLDIPPLAASGSAWAGSEWVMGTLTPVSFANTTALAAAQRICETLGYWLYGDASGTVRAALLERRPSDSPVRTLRWGVDFVIAGPPSRRRPDTIRNRVVIRGANTGVQGAQIRDEWQSGAADRSLELTFELIEYVNESEAGAASCTGAAKRVLKLWDRDPNVIEIPRLKADPRLRVGQTIAVACAPIGYSSPTPFFIYSLSSKLDRRAGDFAQSLTLDGGTGDQGYTTLPPPVASFAWRLVREVLDGVGFVEVFLDGTGSTSFGGEIVSWAWASATAVAAGYDSTASGARAMLVYPAATATAEIALTVTDTSSKTGAITQSVSLAGDASAIVHTRVISLALGAAWAVTPDGGQTWNVEATGDSTLVPEIGGQQLLSTRASGSSGLRGSSDALASASAALASLGGTITALSITDSYPLRVWAAVGASVYQSLDGGATFTLWATLPASVIGILEDPAALGSVFFLVGADFYHGTSAYYAGPSGATARHLVRGASGATTWVAYTGSFIGSPLQRVEGPVAATFPVVSPAVAEIRAIALSADELSVYAWDAQGRGWRVDSATGVATAITATLAAGETAMHALHDPDDPIVYLATFGAAEGTAYKYLPLADVLAPFYVPAGGLQAHRIGLGAAPPRSAQLLALTWGVSGADDGLWRWDGTWTRVGAAPAAGAYWLHMAINPFNDLELIAIGNSQARNDTFQRAGAAITMADGSSAPLWRSADGGATWSAVPLSSPSADGSGLNINSLYYSQVGGAWVVEAVTASATPAKTVVWRGAAGVAAAPLVLPGGTDSYIGSLAIDGQGGDTWIANAIADGTGPYAGHKIAYLAAEASALTVPAGAGAGVGMGYGAALLPGTRRVVALTGGGALWGTIDYRAAQPVSLGVSVGAGFLAALSDGSVIVASSSGIYVIADPFGAATVGVPITDAASRPVTDAASRTVAAVRLSGGYALYGDAWQTVLDPPGVALFAADVRRREDA